MTISDSLLHDITHDILGTCKSLVEIVETHDLDVSEDDLEDRLLDVNVETCPGCGWWFESCMLEESNDDSGKFFCEQCL